MVKVSARHAKHNPRNLAAKIIMWSSALSTLFFWPALRDPFNSPKSWILALGSFWLLGWILFQLKSLWFEAPLKWATILAGVYGTTLFIAMLFTDNTYIGLFGEYQRKNGFISSISLVIFFLASAYSFRIDKLEMLQLTALLLSLPLELYGILQHYKLDFVNWNNPYNSIISTLGNPDFAAATMAIFLILNFGVLLQVKRSRTIRALSLLNVLLLFVAIIFSQVRQALLVSTAALIFILTLWLWQRKKFLAYGITVFFLILSVLSIAGMLQRGPLIKYFFKSSVQFRGDYWRAAWRMFIHHPFVGVGLDRYGANFRQYRDAVQSMRRGPEIVSTNAHNVPLQLAATGGIFVLVTFLALTIYIGWRGIYLVRKFQGKDQLFVGAIFAAWMAYEIQSVVSIDNLGIAIWGYVLGGVLVGLSLPDVSNLKTIRPEPTGSKFVSSLLFLTAFIPVLFFAKEEIAMAKVQRTQLPANQSDFPAYEKFLNNTVSFNFQEPQFQLEIALKEAQVGDYKPAVSLLTKALSHDPRNYDVMNTLAKIYETEKNWDSAIIVRQKILLIDPYNQINLLQLGVDEKLNGNLNAARSVIPLINAFAPNSPEAQQATKEFSR